MVVLVHNHRLVCFRYSSPSIVLRKNDDRSVSVPVTSSASATAATTDHLSIYPAIIYPTIRKG